MELIVGLIISSVAVSVIYYGYRSVLLQNRQITGARIRILKESQLLHSLRKDIQTSIAVSGDQHILYCYFNKNSISYLTENDWIIRNVNGQADTFPMAGCTWEFYDCDGWQTADSSLIDSIALRRTEDRLQSAYGWKRRSGASFYLNQHGS
jgi:hypothetical protein